MLFRFNQFFFDEKDVFIFFLGVFLIFSWIFKLPTFPFRYSSILTIFLFLIITRIKVSYQRFDGYLYLSLIALLLSITFSTYLIILFLFIGFLIYTKYS
ncbi:MAG: hypothetical protein KatS3mg092_0707 [Patescibacteria group bacterium]|nr:MAG: hypothetical protein KatS3mg092_0707 [Patescibacteria group bacterium]